MKWIAILASSVLLSVGSLAHASDYGCKVLLCLANPNGPTAESECVPPIHQLWDDLAHFRPFPSCDMATGPNGQSYAKQGMSYYDPCPTGTTALSQDSFAIQGSPPPNNDGWANQQTLHAGIGSGDGMSPGTGDNYTPLPGKVCVGSLLGNTTVQTRNGGDNGETTVQANTYDRVVMMSPQGSPRIIDVFIDNQLYRRVRW